jgi:hypothetical protein
MTTIDQAVKDLREHLGRPSWLSAIGVGCKDDQPAIILYLVFTPKPKPSFFDDGWEGFPVVPRQFGRVAPLGK